MRLTINQGRPFWFRLPAGFTLVEMLLVVVLLGVLAAAAMPEFFRSYQHLQLQETTNDLAYFMRYAQSRAVLKNQPVRLVFSEDYKRYWLAQLPETDDPDNESVEFVRISGRWGRTFSIPDEIEVRTPATHIEFLSDGQLQKLDIPVCHRDACMTITTRQRRGQIEVLDYAAQQPADENKS